MEIIVVDQDINRDTNRSWRLHNLVTYVVKPWLLFCILRWCNQLVRISESVNSPISKSNCTFWSHVIHSEYYSTLCSMSVPCFLLFHKWYSSCQARICATNFSIYKRISQSWTSTWDRTNDDNIVLLLALPQNVWKMRAFAGRPSPKYVYQCFLSTKKTDVMWPLWRTFTHCTAIAVH